MGRNLYLIGFMGVGKSTVGKRVARNLGTWLMEMDETIEKEQGRTIKDIFAAEGEEYFRDLETDLVRRISQMEGKIVSCGGGAVLREENVKMMKESGHILFLTATPESVYQRVRHSTKRPLLNGNMNVEYIAGLMEKRRTIYEAAADYCIHTDGKTLEMVAKEVKDLLQSL